MSRQIVTRQDYNLVFGVARPLFRLIGQISALSSRRKDRMKPFFDAKFRRSAAMIDANLRAWKPPNESSSAPSLSSNFPSSGTVRDRDIEESVHAALAIRWASILRLHQIVDGYALPHPVPSECLHQILDQLQHIRVGSAVESLMVFPLIMAGSVALSQEERMTIKSRWLIIERTIGFGNIAKGGKLQERVWEAMDREITGDNGEPGKVNVNWASIRWHEFNTFVMF
jgi:transcriptional activator protein UGA3